MHRGEYVITKVSTRAPAKGATANQVYGGTDRSFNSRSREGSDQKHVIVIEEMQSFNSRSREGSDYKD